MQIEPILAFGFVTPFFAAAGLALASIPILIHIFNRRRHKTVQWAAMNFLLAALRKNRRRLRFEQWLLLALRCCVIGLFGLALARPLSCDQSSLASLVGRRSGLHVLIIDNAYPMAYEADRPGAKSQLDQAKVLAKQLLSRWSGSGGESVAIITVARPATALIAEPTFDLAAAGNAVDRIQQSYSDADLSGALQLAHSLGQAHAATPNKSLELITDAARDTWTGPQAGALPALGNSIASLFRISHYSLARSSPSDAALTDLHPAASLVRSDFDNLLIAQPRGFGDLPAANLAWRLDDQPLPGGELVTPTPNSPVQTQSQVAFKSGGFHVISATLAANDRLPIDDTRWAVVDVASELRVLLVEGQRGVGALAGSGAFLSLALAPPSETGTHILAGQQRTASYVQPELISDLELSNKVLSDYRAIILCSVSQVPASQADQLEAFVKAGGTLLLFMGDSVDGQSYNQTLLPRGLLPGPLVKRMSVAGDQKPFLFDFNPSGSLHPLLTAFRNQEKSGLETAPVFTYWKVDLTAAAKAQRVLDYRPDEKGERDPAITLQQLGAGQIVFISTTANSDWTLLPAKPAFVALVHELLAGSISSDDTWLNRTSGQSLEIPTSLQMSAAPTLKDPQQADIPLTSVSGADATVSYRSPPLGRPGVYTLLTGKASYPVAVNLPSIGADVRPIDPAAIRKALGGVELSNYGDQPPPPEAMTLAGSDFGWSIMLIVLIGLAAECVFAMRFGHYR